MAYSSRTSLAALRAGASLFILAAAAPAIAQNAAPAAGAAPDQTAQASPTQANSGQPEEIVVTGFKHSLEEALDNKRNSDLPIESVAPEDMGKLPDQNVAEALQRLPGVQIDRSQGQGTAVLIDGLRQNLVTLNGDIFLTGKEFYVSGEGSGGGAGGNSQYGSLEGIPSDEISGIDVYKNPKASMTEGGLGGTVDLKLRDPLAGPEGWTLGGNMRVTENDHDGDWTPVGTIVGQYKFNDRFGVTAAFSYDEEDTHTYEMEAQNRNQWLITDSALGPYTGALTPASLGTTPGGTIITDGRPNTPGSTSFCLPATPCGIGGQYYIIPQLMYFSDILDSRQTIGATFGVAGKVTDAITARLNWFYSHEDETTYTYSDKLWFNGQGSAPLFLLPSLDPTKPYSIDGNGVVQGATFNANGAETATLFQHNETEANNIQFNTTYNDGGPWRGTLDGAWARATSDLEADQADVEHGLYQTSAGVATSPAAPGCNNGASTCAPPALGSHGYQFSYSNGGTSGLPSFGYLAPYADILNNPAYTTFKSNWAWANLTTQQNWAINGFAEYDPSFIKDVDSTFTAGFRYASRDVDQTFGRYLINGTEAPGVIAGGNTGCGAACGPWLYYQDPGYGTPNIPYSTARSNPGLVQTVNNFAIGNIIVKSPATMSNPSTYLNQVWQGAGVPNNTEQLFTDGLSSFDVKETTTAGYVMGDIGGPSNRFHANFGLRLVETDLTINNGQSAANPTYFGTASWNGVDSNVVPVTHDRSYTDVLPSFNFVLDVSDDEKVRFSAARVVAPQDLFSLGLGNSFNFTRGGSGGVFHFAGGSSGNADLDPYRATQGALAYENYFAPGAIASINGFWKQIDNFVETQNIPTTLPNAGGPGSTTADVTQPVNAGRGKIYGVELGVQYIFDANWMPALEGLGFAGNYTRSISSSDQVTSFSSSAPIPGVAKNALTAQAFYERDGFGLHLSYSWLDTRVNDSLVGATFAFPDQNGNTKVYQIFAAPYGQLDAEVTYDITDNFGLIFQVQNLTDEVQHTYLQWPNLPFTYDDSGVRYFLGAKFKFGSAEAPKPAAAPVAPAPAPTPPPPPPAVEAKRSFQVFFDFDKSNITQAAAHVIQEAADAVKAGHVVQITVTGHTDTVGTASYNQGLSERRAASVKTQLVTDGVPGGEVTTIGVGKNGLLVPTADGVREPQNRRAEIVLQ